MRIIDGKIILTKVPEHLLYLLHLFSRSRIAEARDLFYLRNIAQLIFFGSTGYNHDILSATKCGAFLMKWCDEVV